MIALIQRVSQASVAVDGAVVGRIGRGVLALVCAERTDSETAAAALVAKLLAYRIFPDEQGRMNRSLADIDGELLAVPQFTLAADTNSGTRPSFTPAAPPELGERLGIRALRERAPCPRGAGRVRRAHAGATDQRRPGDVLAADASSGR
jgi:D-aminoacyl-tRNA deacylase